MSKEIIKAMLAGLLLVACACITVPLNPMVARCMIAYTADSYSTLKLDLKFPPIPDQRTNQAYQISIYNTQTKKTEYDTIDSGSYKKELDLQQNAIYRFCFKAVTNRQVGTLLLEYIAETDYIYTAESIQVPDSLLKDDDLKNIYGLVSNMQGQVLRHQDSTKKKKDQEVLEYEEFIDKNNKVIGISYIEIGAILVIGFYQFFTIRKFLVDKQYM